MQSSRLLQLVFALTSLLSAEARDVSGSGVSCLRSSPAGDGRTRVTFLREDAGGVRTLRVTLWSEDARLLKCEVSTGQLTAERRRALCEGGGAQGPDISRRFNISASWAPDAPCALTSSPSSSPASTGAPKFTGRTAGDGTEAKARRRRAWIFPGTLWCGTGSTAVGYEQLGMFESADRCCREHDHCLHIIPAFTVNYGVFNSKFFTVSHCDCDQRFRQCLLGVNDTISSMVGYSFFNLLKVPCFELKLQKRCTEISWWGRCKVVKKAPYAVFKSPHPYDSSNITSRYEDSTVSNKLTTGEGQHVTQSPTISPHRKSHKSVRRCSTRDPPRGDTFYRRRAKGKGCKRHRKLHTVASSQMPPTSRAHSTTPSMTTGLLSTVVMSNKKKHGRKKSIRKGQPAYPTQRNPAPPLGTTKSYPQTTSTTRSTPPLTQSTARRLQSPAATTAVSSTTKGHRKASKQSSCCGLKPPLRGDTFQPHCKGCLEQKNPSGMTTVTALATTYAFPIKASTLETLQKTAKTTEQDTLKRRSAAVTAVPATTRLKTSASNHKDGKAQRQMDSRLFWTNTSQESPNTRAWRHLKQNIALHNMTDKQLPCESLKHLDDCKHKIPPLEKKYDLQNTESKTAYHCDCTTRLAVQIESSKQPAVLRTLLMDFVSQRCFKLPKKKCHSRKSCSGGFTKASDLLRAVKKIEEKDTAGVRNSSNDRKRRIPVRLYKRCLRLQREADIMARLT